MFCKKSITSPTDLEKRLVSAPNDEKEMVCKIATDLCLIEYQTMNFDSLYHKGLAAHEMHRRKKIGELVALFLGAFLGAISTELIHGVFTYIHN